MPEIIVALDVSSVDEARNLVGLIRAEWYKVGLELIYAEGVNPRQVEATPIGVTCRLCHRAACRARAAPPIGREILPDDYRRAAEPFTFGES